MADKVYYVCDAYNPFGMGDPARIWMYLRSTREDKIGPLEKICSDLDGLHEKHMKERAEWDKSDYIKKALKQGKETRRLLKKMEDLGEFAGIYLVPAIAFREVTEDGSLRWLKKEELLYYRGKVFDRIPDFAMPVPDEELLHPTYGAGDTWWNFPGKRKT